MTDVHERLVRPTAERTYLDALSGFQAIQQLMSLALEHNSADLRHVVADLERIPYAVREDRILVITWDEDASSRTQMLTEQGWRDLGLTHTDQFCAHELMMEADGTVWAVHNEGYRAEVIAEDHQHIIEVSIEDVPLT